MKTNALMLVAASLLASPAHAALTCIDPTTTDSSYIVEISETRENVLVKSVSIAGTTNLDVLPCVRLAKDPLNVLPGSNALSCRHTDTVDHGFTATIKNINQDGRIEATLEMQSLAGPQILAQLNCVEMP